jgi:DNA-binding winged helix-turn-helix (wHTH) protein/tetratricopeptide (TPR) repeat protein
MSEENLHAFKFGPFILDAEARRLSRDGKYVPLAVKPFDILFLLVQNRGRLITKEELMSAVWPDQFVEENNLTVRISALRKALGERPREHKYIETVPGRGYRFVATVKKVENEGDGEPGRSPAVAARQEAVGGSPGAPTYLAVLPFVNESVDPNTEYLSEGITENVIDSLSLLPQLKVIARSAVYRYNGREIDPYSVGRELGVKAVLVGRVSLVGDTLVVSAELMSVTDHSHIWGARYERRLPDILFLQEEIAREVSGSLRVRLAGEGEKSAARRYSYNPDAHLLHLKGQYFWNKRSNKGIMKAVEYFQKAIELDPSYAPAHVGLADCYIILADYGVLSPSELFPKARTAIVRALALDDGLAEAHAAQAKVMLLYDWDWVGAEREYRRAIELNPSYAPAYQWYAVYLAKSGRFTDALLEVKKAQRLDPLSLGLNRLVALILYFARQYERAIEQCLETLEIDPDFGPIYGVLGLCYVEMGMYEEAIATFQKFISFVDYQFPASWDKESIPQLPQQVGRSEPDPEALALLAYACAKAKDKEGAVDILNSLIKLYKHRYAAPHAMAIIYTALGDRDQAFKWLEKSYAERSSALTNIGVWPLFDDLRPDKRFVNLLRRVGLTS